MSADRRAAVAVVMAAVLFGSTFVVTQDSVEDASPTAFLAARFLIGAAILLAFAAARREQRRPPSGVAWPTVACGAALAVGYAFQTVGLQYTESSTSAFITYLLVVFVAVLAAVLHRTVPPPAVLGGLALALAGLWLLAGGGAGLGRGEVLTLGCALAFAVHILLLDRYSPRFDTAWLTGLQLLVVGVACLVPAAVQGELGFGASAWVGAVTTGVGCSALAFALQVSGQRRIGPTRTSLLLMIEPVTAAVLGYAVGERLGLRGGLGAALILGGIGLAESRSAAKPTPDILGMRETSVITGHSGASGTSDLGGTP